MRWLVGDVLLIIYEGFLLLLKVNSVSINRYDCETLYCSDSNQYRFNHSFYKTSLYDKAAIKIKPELLNKFKSLYGYA